MALAHADRLLAAGEGAADDLRGARPSASTATSRNGDVADVERLPQADDLALAVRPDHRSGRRGRRHVDGLRVGRIAADAVAEGVKRNEGRVVAGVDADEDVVVLA